MKSKKSARPVTGHEKQGTSKPKRLRQALNASPVYRHLHMRVAGARSGSSRIELEIGEEVKNLHGIVHGGILAALVDSACGAALGTLLGPGETLVTLDLRINYIAPAEDGMLVAEGKVVHLGRQTGVAEATVMHQGSRLVAKGMTTHFLQRLPASTG